MRGQTMPPPRPPLQQWWEDPALIGGASTMKGALEIVSETTHHTAAFSHDFLANYIDEAEDFYHAVAEQREPAATGVDGLRAVEVTLAVITAAREGRTVKIERHMPSSNGDET